VVKDTLLPQVHKQLPKNLGRVMTEILEYFDKYNSVYSTTQLTHQPLFSESDREVIYRGSGLEEHEVKDTMVKSSTYNSSRNVSGNPFYVSCILCASYCMKNNKGKKEKEAMLILQYMAANMYTSIHHKYLKYGATESVMTYTANHISGTKLADAGSLGEMIKDQIRQCIRAYKKRLENPTDTNIEYIIAAVSTRMNNRLKPVFKAYYKYKASGVYLNMESAIDDGDEYRELDNDLYIIDRVVNGLYINLTNGKVDHKIYKFATASNNISSQKFHVLMEDIIDEEDEKIVRKYISSIIEYFHFYAKNPLSELNRNTFSATMLSAYASSTTADQMNYSKDTMDIWLKEYGSKGASVRYGKTAASNYKKAIYTFFVYLIKNYRP